MLGFGRGGREGERGDKRGWREITRMTGVLLRIFAAEGCFFFSNKICKHFGYFCL